MVNYILKEITTMWIEYDGNGGWQWRWWCIWNLGAVVVAKSDATNRQTEMEYWGDGWNSCVCWRQQYHRHVDYVFRDVTPRTLAENHERYRENTYLHRKGK